MEANGMKDFSIILDRLTPAEIEQHQRRREPRGEGVAEEIPVPIQPQPARAAAAAPTGSGSQKRRKKIRRPPVVEGSGKPANFLMYQPIYESIPSPTWSSCSSGVDNVPDQPSPGKPSASTMQSKSAVANQGDSSSASPPPPKLFRSDGRYFLRRVSHQPGHYREMAEGTPSPKKAASRSNNREKVQEGDQTEEGTEEVAASPPGPKCVTRTAITHAQGSVVDVFPETPHSIHSASTEVASPERADDSGLGSPFGQEGSEAVHSPPNSGDNARGNVQAGGKQLEEYEVILLEGFKYIDELLKIGALAPEYLDDLVNSRWIKDSVEELMKVADADLPELSQQDLEEHGVASLQTIKKEEIQNWAEDGPPPLDDVFLSVLAEKGDANAPVKCTKSSRPRRRSGSSTTSSSSAVLADKDLMKQFDQDILVIDVADDDYLPLPSVDV